MHNKWKPYMSNEVLEKMSHIFKKYISKLKWINFIIVFEH
jgi:hypothetical protein